jgi:hypothetical protein
MKKTYFKPEMEVVDINTFQPLLAGSVTDLNTDSDVEIESGDILAPEIDMGLPSYFFE